MNKYLDTLTYRKILYFKSLEYTFFATKGLRNGKKIGL